MQYNLYKTMLLLVILVGTFISCQNEKTAEQNSQEDFKQAHDEPKAIEFTGKGEMNSIEVTDGTPASAYTLLAKEESDKYLFVIHEWWGLNDFVKRESDRLYNDLEGKVNVMALDLYDGNVATNRDDAQKFMSSVEETRLNNIITAAINQTGEFAEIATIGWCFGGGWSLKTSIMAANKGAGCVMYYGMPVAEAKDLMPLEADVLGIFAKEDKWITPEVAATFEALGKATGKNVETKIFDANHAFANPSSEAYKSEAATEANELARDFLRERLL
jgi:carboxymethylenebutenolidase